MISQNECYFAPGRSASSTAAFTPLNVAATATVPTVTTAAPTAAAAAPAAAAAVADQFLTSIEGQPLSSIRGGTDLHLGGVSDTGTAGTDIQQHLQSMFYLLRKEETLKMAVKLETARRSGRTRYLVVVSRPISCGEQQQNGVDGGGGGGGEGGGAQHSCESSQFCNESEESCLLGIDCNETTTVGLVLRILADTKIRLDGDG